MKHKPIWVWAGMMRERRIEKAESMKEGKIARSKGERERETNAKTERPNITLSIWDPRFRN
jgi:hypothetical protein